MLHKSHERRKEIVMQCTEPGPSRARGTIDRSIFQKISVVVRKGVLLFIVVRRTKKSVNLSIFLRFGCHDDPEENGVLLIEKIPSVHIIVGKSNACVTIYTQSVLRVSMKQRKRIYFHRIV
jgi:hypothetical protein